MKLFETLYQRVLRWSAHRRAEPILGVLSFAESSFFPIPPDVMLAPMVMAKPSRWLVYCHITTLASTLGGVFGYALGYFALDAVLGLLSQDSVGAIERARTWFDDYGLWAVLIAGFSPVPYKLFTITAGAMDMFLPLFILASLLGRGARFYLVGAVVRYAGARLEKVLLKRIEYLGWGLFALLLGMLLLW